MSQQPRLDANEVRARIGDGWRDVLVRLGIPKASLARSNVPCPACGGTDRFTFERHKRGNGDFYCRGCGGGDGFTLLMRVNGWDFSTALKKVIEVAGLADNTCADRRPATPQRAEPDVAQPTRRVRDLLRTSCHPSDVLDVVRYLKSRRLFPLPSVCGLRAHVGADYYEDYKPVARYPALVAPIADIDCDLVTVHVTYIERGAKLANRTPRKLLGKLTGRRGCAVRLAPATDVVGIAEGIETALAAMALHKLPVWAALSAGMLAKFEPPAGIERVVIFADADRAGLEAAWHLRDRLGMACELHVPPAPSKDWADALAVVPHA